MLQFTIVTATGEHLTANSYQNSDLFWALRGGGGGTYGVVTSATYRARPSVPIVGVFLTTSLANGTVPNAAMSQAFTELVRITPELEDAGWGGYVVSGSTARGQLQSTLFFIMPNATLAHANTTINPYLEFVQRVAANSTQTGNTADVLNIDQLSLVPFPTWFDWYELVFPSNGTGGTDGSNVEGGSWLLSQEALESRHEEVAQTLLGIPGFHF